MKTWPRWRDQERWGGYDVVIGERRPRAGSQKNRGPLTRNRTSWGLRTLENDGVFAFANLKEGHPTCGSQLFVSKFVEGQLRCHHRVPLGVRTVRRHLRQLISAV